MTKHTEDNLPINFSDCTRSRHDKQWFEQFVPVADLAFNLLLMAFCIMSTMFHHKKGNENKSLSARVLMAFSMKGNAKKGRTAEGPPILHHLYVWALSVACLFVHCHVCDAEGLGDAFPPNVASHRSSHPMSQILVAERSFHNSLTNNRCMPWTWYIGTEFIYYLISPVFLLLRRQSPQLGVGFSVAVIAASAGANWIKIVNNNFPPTQFLWKQPEMFNPNFIQHHIELYIKPQYRIGPYVIGILLGYYLAKYQRQPVKPERSRTHVGECFSGLFQIGGWVFGAACIIWGLYGLFPSLQAWDWPAYHVIYGCIHRDVFALGIAWLIYACHTGIGGFVNTVLSAKVLLPLSNLSYSVYLFHMIPVVLTYLLVPFPLWFDAKWPILAHLLRFRHSLHSDRRIPGLEH